MENMHYTSEEEMEEIFGSASSYDFDGVHPKGRLGRKLYNECLIAAVRTAGIAPPKERRQRQEQQAAPTGNRFEVLN